MSKKASKTLIGAFVIGAIVIVVAGVIIFGSGKFFSKRQQFVMFFEGSVKGLQVGAPVAFRGVKIGEVKDIILRFNPENMAALVPVYVEIDPKRFLVETAAKLKPYQYYEALIKKGLKAQLELQSFVTGQLQISLDFHPEKPVKLTGLDTKHHEIPTIPTTMQELQKAFQNLPLKEMTEKLESTLGGIDKLVNSPELQQTTASLNQALKSADMLLKNIDAEIKPMVASLKNSSDAATATLVQAKETLAMKDGVPGEIASNLKETLKSARLALDATQKAAGGMEQIAAQNANLGYTLNRSFEQMTALSRSLRSFTDYLDRHPEAFIRGKSPSKGE